ncbi:unnamed protein product, partial [Didymodactylos carnosus]
MGCLGGVEVEILG